VLLRELLGAVVVARIELGQRTVHAEHGYRGAEHGQNHIVGAYLGPESIPVAVRRGIQESHQEPHGARQGKLADDIVKSEVQYYCHDQNQVEEDDQNLETAIRRHLVAENVEGTIVHVRVLDKDIGSASGNAKRHPGGLGRARAVVGPGSQDELVQDHGVQPGDTSAHDAFDGKGHRVAKVRVNGKQNLQHQSRHP